MTKDLLNPIKISIIIPAYNEEKRIGRTLERYCEFFGELKKKNLLDFEILIVLNACKDNTLGVVKEKQKKFREIKYLEFKQGGKGFAITQGFKDALKRENDLIGFVDADMATPPEAFSDLIRFSKNYDGIIASRGLKKSAVNFSFTRKITHKGFNFLVRALLGMPYRDTQCGAKVFKREVIKSIVDNLGATKWAYDIDLLYKIRKRGFKIIEIPTIWENKEGSHLDLIKVPIQMFSSIVRLRLIFSPFRFIVRAYDRLPEKVKIHNL